MCFGTLEGPGMSKDRDCPLQSRMDVAWCRAVICSPELWEEVISNHDLLVCLDRQWSPNRSNKKIPTRKVFPHRATIFSGITIQWHLCHSVSTATYRCLGVPGPIVPFPVPIWGTFSWIGCVEAATCDSLKARSGCGEQTDAYFHFTLYICLYSPFPHEPFSL